MPPLLSGACTLGCVVVGLLVPTLAYRLSVPHGAPIRRTCHNCMAPLSFRTRGWSAVRRARCGACGLRLGTYPWLTGAVSGVAGGLLTDALGPVDVLPLFVGAALLGVLLGTVDISCHRLPDLLVLPALGITTVLFTGVAALSGQWHAWQRGLLASLLLGLLFTLLALLSRGGFGLGDAKLLSLLGWYLGWRGWDTVTLGALLPWAVNAPVVLALLAVGRAGWKTRLPFGPALLVGGLLAVLISAR